MDKCDEHLEHYILCYITVALNYRKIVAVKNRKIVAAIQCCCVSFSNTIAEGVTANLVSLFSLTNLTKNIS